MGTTLTPENLPAGPDRKIHQGHDIGALGPSDSSDSGSDMRGAVGSDELNNNSDRNGSGERADVEGDAGGQDGADIGADHVEKMPGKGDED